MPAGSSTVSGVRPRCVPAMVTSAPAGTERTVRCASGWPSVTGPTASVWPPLSTTLLSQVFQPLAAMRMRRTPEGAATDTGAAPLSTPSMLTAATTPAVSICSWPGSFASTRRSRSAPPRCTTSAASAGRYPSRSARTRCGPGETHSRPPRCSDSAPGARTRASSGCTSTTTDPSRPIRNTTTAAAASHPSHFALALVARTRAPACGTPSAGGTSISSSSSPPSPGDTAASAPAGAMVTLPARCSTESLRSVREASLTRTCASPTLSTSSRRRSRSASSGRPLKRSDASEAGSTSQTPLLRRIESAAPAGTPGTTTSDPAPPIVSASPSTRSPAGSRTRTCPHAAGCIDTPLLMRSSDGLGAGDAHRLGRLSRADGDVATHVAVAVARADHGVTPGLELDVAPGEGARAVLTQHRLVQPQRLAPVLSGLEGLAARALRGIGTLARDRVDAPQPLGGFGPVRTQAARPEERGTRLLEASGPERCEPLARRPRVTVVAQRGVHAGEPGAGLGILRVDRQRPRVVLSGARILALGLCVLGIGEQRKNAGELSRASLAERGSRVLAVDARRQIEGLGRELLLPGSERSLAGNQLRGECRGRRPLDRVEQPRGLREALLCKREAPGVVGADRLRGARLGGGEVRATPNARAAALERGEPGVENGALGAESRRRAARGRRAVDERRRGLRLHPRVPRQPHEGGERGRGESGEQEKHPWGAAAHRLEARARRVRALAQLLPQRLPVDDSRSRRRRRGAHCLHGRAPGGALLGRALAWRRLARRLGSLEVEGDGVVARGVERVDTFAHGRRPLLGVLGEHPRDEDRK